MVEPTACSPAAGWEKGQVENQVQTIRDRFFQPRLRFASFEELNGWLEAECRPWAAMQTHPEQKDITIAQVLKAELPALQPMLAPFDGFHESQHAVTGTCLISFDRNRYSVAARAVRRAVQVRAYADRIIVRLSPLPDRRRVERAGGVAARDGGVSDLAQSADLEKSDVVPHIETFAPNTIMGL